MIDQVCLHTVVAGEQVREELLGELGASRWSRSCITVLSMRMIVLDSSALRGAAKQLTCHGGFHRKS